MRIVKPEIEIMHPCKQITGTDILKHIELCGRVCYKSEGRIAEGSAEKFVAALIRRGHESVLEHYSITVRIICDRATANQLVRHRIASYSQESTRYCNYASDRFERDISVIMPDEIASSETARWIWTRAMRRSEMEYKRLLKEEGIKPEVARGVLPHDLKTEVVATMNLREWRHVLKLRTSPGAQDAIKRIMHQVLSEFKAFLPAVFDDLEGVSSDGEKQNRTA